MEWSSGILKVRCRRADMEVWRYGGLEACCTSADVEILEVWRSGYVPQALQTWYGGIERWR